MYRLLPRLHCVSGVWCANCWTHRMLVSAVCSWKITFILQRSSSRHVQFSVSQGISSEAQVLQNLPNEGILIFSMLHRYRRAKGDMKETSVITGVKYECLEVKENKTSGLICSFRRWENFALGSLPTSICSSRTKTGWRSHTDLHFTALPFPDASLSIVFSSSNKKSCWHAACLRGVIHHCERKEAQDEYIQKDVFTCVHYFNFNFSCSQPPDSSMQPETGSYTSHWDKSKHGARNEVCAPYSTAKTHF